VSHGWQARRTLAVLPAVGRVGQADLSAVARRAKADVAQLAERVLGKDEVTSSILVIGSTRLGRFAASLVAGLAGRPSRRATEVKRKSDGNTTGNDALLSRASAHAYGERKI
jgi:hypothetical protein